MRLQGKRVLITGGGTGIGRAIAQRFIEEGALVLITGRREEKLIEVAKELSPISIYAADLTEPEGPAKILEAAVRELGGLEVLINNAGVFQPGPIDASDDSIYDHQFDTNVKAVYRMSRAALKELRKGAGANIVNIGSVLSLIAIPGTSVYAASKGAVAQITRSFAAELGPEGIRCNCVCPGLIQTDLTDFMVTDPDFVEQNLPAYPLGRFGKTVDIANACVFLASEEANWITGAILPVDGGYTAR